MVFFHREDADEGQAPSRLDLPRSQDGSEDNQRKPSRHMLRTEANPDGRRFTAAQDVTER
jgi:hypothetical protein